LQALPKHLASKERAVKFLIDLEIVPEDGGESFTREQVREHLQTYIFDTNTSFEMSLEPDDPYHEVEGGKYRTYSVAYANVQIVEE
jgi:hypothetical protein